MIRVNILCEGATEEKFVKEVLYAHFLQKGILVTPRGLDGGNNYGKIKYNIVEWLNADKTAFVTTMIDLYGMNEDFPGYDLNKSLPALEKAVAIEQTIKNSILKSKSVHNQRFIPYIQLHEFEALLFTDPILMEDWLSLDRDIEPNSFVKIANAFESPEHINDSKYTAPSKRILKVAPFYDKINDGVIITADIGLTALCAKCKHFANWINILENLK
jgi:Domain of unknown function (DUF4276)